MPDFEDYYEILQVHHLAEPEVIQKAYMALANKYHPDKNPSAAAAAKMRKINYAYDILKDPDKRKKYDTESTDRKQAARASAEKPKPVVDPNSIKFTNVSPKTIQRSSFVIRNAGGSYKKIWFSNPGSWVKVTKYTSLTGTDELPLKVELEAVGTERDRDYVEFITVRLDDEETRVRIDMSTQAAPIDKPKPVHNEKFAGFVRPLWFKLTVGVALLALIALAVFQLIPSLTKVDVSSPATQSSATSPGQSPASIPMPAPTPEPIPPVSGRIMFTEVDLSSIANFTNIVNNFPGGAQIFNGIQFNLSQNHIFTTQYGAAALPNTGVLDVSIDHPHKVFILINTTDTFHKFMNMQAGNITLVFDNGASEKTYLIVGQNVREYTMDPATVQTITDPATQVAWQGQGNRSFTIDMLSIPINSINQASTLKRIIITDVSETLLGSRDPGLVIWGITVARYSEE
jgi:hypothetical protein